MHRDRARVFRPEPGVAICAYRPVPDLHLPLVDHADGPWRLIAWAIVPAEGGFSDYFAAFLAESPDVSLPPEMEIPTSFGPRRLVLAETIDELPAAAVGPVADVLLKAAGRRTEAEIATVLAAVARLGAPSSESVRGRLEADGSRLVVEGVLSGTRVAGGLAGDAPVVATTRRLAYDGAPTMRSSFDLDRSLPAGDVIVLGEDAFVRVDCGEAR